MQERRSRTAWRDRAIAKFGETTIGITSLNHQKSWKGL